MTPLQIQNLAEPVEQVYGRVVDDLLKNIVRHIENTNWTHTARWEIQKLSELGQLTQENAAIINRHIKQIPRMVREMMEETRQQTLSEIERTMERAARDGYVTPPARDSTMDGFADLLSQAEDRLNLTNTTMLQSSIDAYSEMVTDLFQRAEYIERAEATREILNVHSAAYIGRTETLVGAVHRTIEELNERGLTGFVDRAGHHWSVEAYVNMVIRTTASNTAIQTTQRRMSDYGVSVFQISAHPGARPLCEPYQGWFCTWSGAEGEITLGNGETVEYVGIWDTSYGEPAGIFGINCGHHPIPMVAGYSIPRAQEDIQSAEENRRVYQQSQEQRALERAIRAAKREIYLQGDNATPADREALRAAQSAMRQFIEETGRVRRYDREQIYTGG